MPQSLANLYIHLIFSTKVANDIRNQEEHHRVKTFQEEYREFLTRHQIQFDERYVWD